MIQSTANIFRLSPFLSLFKTLYILSIMKSASFPPVLLWNFISIITIAEFVVDVNCISDCFYRTTKQRLFGNLVRANMSYVW